MRRFRRSCSDDGTHRLRLLDLQRRVDAGGQQMARRDNADPGGLGNYQNWGFSWPANRRMLYNRAGATPTASRGMRSRAGDPLERQSWAG